MNYTFVARFILLICCLIQGLFALRLIKVSIPAYKLRGESAFLECQYELNRSQGTPKPYGSDANYVDVESAEKERTDYRRGRTYQQLRQHQYQYQHQHQHQHQHQQHRIHYPQAQAYQAFEPHYQIQPSQQPNGHSQYRGSSQLAQHYGGQVGASTYAVGGNLRASYMTHADLDHDDSFGESTEDEHSQPDGEALYAIKWYKDNEEFYRYVPKARPPKTSYRVDGVRVVEEHSDMSRVFLRGLTLNSTGLYRCEVSAEAPNFSSVQGEGRLDIVYLPRDGPHIRGQQFQYTIGETLNLNCTSGKSHPASHLQWFINEHPVVEARYLIKYNDTVHKHGLITSTLGLQLTLDSRHFAEGEMRVKCLASISPVLWKGGKESVLQRRPGIIDNREAMLLVRSHARSLRHESNLLRLITITSILASLYQLLLRTELT